MLYSFIRVSTTGCQFSSHRLHGHDIHSVEQTSINFSHLVYITAASNCNICDDTFIKLICSENSFACKKVFVLDLLRIRSFGQNVVDEVVK